MQIAINDFSELRQYADNSHEVYWTRDGEYYSDKSILPNWKGYGELMWFNWYDKMRKQGYVLYVILSAHEYINATKNK